MKKLLLCVLLVPALLLQSQEINKAFLESLPADIKDDIQKKVDDQVSSEEPVYRGLESTAKLEKKKIEDLKIRLENDLKYLETYLQEEDLKKESDLSLFGSKFFNTYQSTYMPINEPNLSSSYVLDFGDVLEIQLVGQKDESKSYSVKRDGSIKIPEIGPIHVSGISLLEASELIKTKIGSTFIGTRAFITLKNMRDINVLVSGNAFNPGIYTVSGNSTMLHVLGVAGGINEQGSYREINLIRDNVVIETLDIYDILITGRYNAKTILKTGDVVFVKAVKNIISIDGAVKRPAMFEFLDDQNLYDIFEYANGLNNYADLNNVYLNRVLDSKVESLPIRSINQFKEILAKDGDAIYIRKHNFKKVNIVGSVMKPGTYMISQNETLSDLIEKAGGYTTNAYPFGAVYETQKAFVINQMAKDKLYEEFIDNIISSSQKNPSARLDLTSIVELTQSLKDTMPNGRVVIDIKDNASNNLILQDGDQITIPEKTNHIYIYGEVNYEGALNYKDGNDLDYYLDRSGGLKANANKNSIYVLNPNGDTHRIYASRKNLFQNNPNSELVKIYPGSVIFVPKAIDNSATNRLAAQAYVSILGNIGIALASLSSINNN